MLNISLFLLIDTKYTRSFFSKIPAPQERGPFLENLLTHFSKQYLACNPHLHYTQGMCVSAKCSYCVTSYLSFSFFLPSCLLSLPDTIYLICYSLILLSVDLTSPCVKNKMSKREFIRNLRGVVSGVGDDTIGHMYDNIYLHGHVATQDT